MQTFQFQILSSQRYGRRLDRKLRPEKDNDFDLTGRETAHAFLSISIAGLVLEGEA